MSLFSLFDSVQTAQFAKNITTDSTRTTRSNAAVHGFGSEAYKPTNHSPSRAYNAPQKSNLLEETQPLREDIQTIRGAQGANIDSTTKKHITAQKKDFKKELAEKCETHLLNLQNDITHIKPIALPATGYLTLVDTLKQEVLAQENAIRERDALVRQMRADIKQVENIKKTFNLKAMFNSSHKTGVTEAKEFLIDTLPLLREADQKSLHQKSKALVKEEAIILKEKASALNDAIASAATQYKTDISSIKPETNSSKDLSHIERLKARIAENKARLDLATEAKKTIDGLAVTHRGLHGEQVELSTRIHALGKDYTSGEKRLAHAHEQLNGQSAKVTKDIELYDKKAKTLGKQLDLAEAKESKSDIEEKIAEIKKTQSDYSKNKMAPGEYATTLASQKQDLETLLENARSIKEDENGNKKPGLKTGMSDADKMVKTLDLNLKALALTGVKPVDTKRFYTNENPSFMPHSAYANDMYDFPQSIEHEEGPLSKQVNAITQQIQNDGLSRHPVPQYLAPFMSGPFTYPLTHEESNMTTLPQLHQQREEVLYELYNPQRSFDDQLLYDYTESRNGGTDAMYSQYHDSDSNTLSLDEDEELGVDEESYELGTNFLNIKSIDIDSDTYNVPTPSSKRQHTSQQQTTSYNQFSVPSCFQDSSQQHNMDSFSTRMTHPQSHMQAHMEQRDHGFSHATQQQYTPQTARDMQQQSAMAHT